MPWVSRIMTQSLKPCPANTSVYSDAVFPGNKTANDSPSFLCISCPFVGQVLLLLLLLLPPPLLLQVSHANQSPIPLPEHPGRSSIFWHGGCRGSQLSSGGAGSFCHAFHTPRNVVSIQRHTGSSNSILEAKLSGPKYLGHKSAHVCSCLRGSVD